jgi:hypothetical protein
MAAYIYADEEVKCGLVDYKDLWTYFTNARPRLTAGYVKERNLMGWLPLGGEA